MKTAQTIAVLFLACMLIFSTSGLAIYTHYCNAKNSNTANFFQVTTCCGSSHDQTSERSCCAESENVDLDVISSQSCCSHDLSYVKINVVNSNTKKADLLPEFSPNHLSLIFTVFFNNTFVEKSTPHTYQTSLQASKSIDILSLTSVLLI